MIKREKNVWLKTREHGLITQREISKTFGIGEKSWQKYESGERKPPLWLMARIAKHLNMPIEKCFSYIIEEELAKRAKK